MNEENEKICRQAWNDMYHKCRPQISYESYKYIWEECILKLNLVQYEDAIK